jgi:hypothetical protein
MAGAWTVEAQRVENWCGPRITHFTYRAKVSGEDGAVTKCPHLGHKTEAAAIKCGQVIVRRSRKQQV